RKVGRSRPELRRRALRANAGSAGHLDAHEVVGGGCGYALPVSVGDARREPVERARIRDVPSPAADDDHPGTPAAELSVARLRARPDQVIEPPLAGGVAGTVEDQRPRRI